MTVTVMPQRQTPYKCQFFESFEYNGEKSTRAGHAVYDAIHMIKIFTGPNGIVERKITPKDEATYKEEYAFWKSTREIPVTGTPIRTWPVLGPAEVATLLDKGILTVEALAELPDDRVQDTHPMARSWRGKAQEWLATAKNVGVATEKSITLQREIANLKEILAEKDELIKKLQKKVADLAAK